MGLRKNFRNRAGVNFNFSEVSRVQFLRNRNNTMTVEITVLRYLNRAERNNNSDPVEVKKFTFQRPINENIGRLNRYALDLLLTTPEYSGSSEE